MNINLRSDNPIKRLILSHSFYIAGLLILQSVIYDFFIADASFRTLSGKLEFQDMGAVFASIISKDW